MKILIVDDDQSILNSLNAGLTSFGHKVVSAIDGQQALKKIESSIEASDPMTLLVTDLIMPGMNGLELIQAARRLLPELLAILITAYGVKPVREKVEKLNKCGYLEKTFDLSMLLKMIDEVAEPANRNENVN